MMTSTAFMLATLQPSLSTLAADQRADLEIYLDSKLIEMWAAAERAFESFDRARQLNDSHQAMFDFDARVLRIVESVPGDVTDTRLWPFTGRSRDLSFLGCDAERLAALPQSFEEPRLEERRLAIIQAWKDYEDFQNRPEILRAKAVFKDAFEVAHELISGIAGASAHTIAGIRIKARAIKWLGNNAEASNQCDGNTAIDLLLGDLLSEVA